LFTSVKSAVFSSEFGIALIALLGFILVGWGKLLAKSANDRTIYYWIGVVVVSVAVVLGVTQDSPATRWQWLLGSLPTLILFSHGAFLYYVRSKVVPRATAMMAPTGPSNGVDDDLSYKHLLEAGERYFSAQAMLLRYAVPGVLLLGISLGISNVILRFAEHHYFYDFDCKAPLVGACQVLGKIVENHAQPRVASASVVFLPLKAVVGAAYGLIGAYAYVLLFLGKRSFRLDITPGAATWCMVTMGVGPVLAGFLGLFVFEGDTVQIGTDAFSRIAVLFLAGFSPRFVVESLEEAGRRVFMDPAKNSLPSRTQPLTAVQGMSRDNQERLAEEGIDDASQLAMADPYRLLRNTSYDKRQIISWMDRALLMTRLPEGYLALERRGITGAMALVWYVEEEKDKSDTTRQDAFKVLASEARIDETILRAVGRQLAADRQLRLLRILYVLDDGENERLLDGKPG
jgi:hypothetical protein